MKKTYEAPSIEKVEFQYRDQVVVASGISGTVCTQAWTGLGDGTVSGCKYETVVSDSGL